VAPRYCDRIDETPLITLASTKPAEAWKLLSEALDRFRFGVVGIVKNRGSVAKDKDPRRYTDLSALFYLLAKRNLTLLNPNRWDNKNDSYCL
jgi:hypothetical protein